MTQTIAVVLCLAVALFGASNANPFEIYDDAGLGGPTEVAMQEALLKFKTACVEISGSDAGYEKAINALSPTIQCVIERFDTVSFSLDLPDTAEARKTITDQYCPAFNESVACFDEMLEGIAMCGNDTVSTLKSMYKKMIQNMVDLMCKNNGQVFLEAGTPEFRSCLQHVRTNEQQCKVSDFISEVRRLKQCIHEQVSTCNNTAFEDIFNAIFEPVAEAAKCKMNVQLELNANEI